MDAMQQFFCWDSDFQCSSQLARDKKDSDLTVVLNNKDTFLERIFVLKPISLVLINFSKYFLNACKP